MISLPKTVVNFASGSWRVRFQGEVEVLFSSRISFTRYIVILLVFLHLFDCLWMVVEFFDVDGCRSFLLSVTTQNEVNNCGKVTLEVR